MIVSQVNNGFWLKQDLKIGRFHMRMKKFNNTVLNLKVYF